MTVERRYNDFVWLYNRLVATNPGIIVPPIPEKNAFGKLTVISTDYASLTSN